LLLVVCSIFCAGKDWDHTKTSLCS